MYYYIYQITNKINGKIYVGAHSSRLKNDNYMGSGVSIKNAIKKYGVENFVKTIIEEFDNEHDMYARESEIVSTEFLNRDDTYNLGLGGTGGTMRENRKPFTGPHSEKTRDLLREQQTGRKHSDKTRSKISENNFAKRDPVAQRQHASNAAKQKHKYNADGLSDETKSKISATLLERNMKNREQGTPHPLTGIKRVKVKCPHCGKLGAKNTMVRFHFDNCKEKTMAAVVKLVDTQDCDSCN